MEFAKRGNIEYSDKALANLILESIVKYEVEVLNDDIVSFKENKVEVYLELLIKEKMATVSGTANVVRNEIIDVLDYFSGLEVNAIQIQIKKGEK